MEKEFEPLLIKDIKMGVLESHHHVDIAKHTLKAVEFACHHKLKYIIVCNIMSPSSNGLNLVTSFAVNSDDFLENLKDSLVFLEEEEEYECCSKTLELMKLIPTIEFTQNRLAKDIVSILLDL
jgi:hypothetical protein